MLPAYGYVTASANPTATAASIAFPPDCSTRSPTSAASGSCATTIACRACTGCRADQAGSQQQRTADLDSHRISILPWCRQVHDQATPSRADAAARDDIAPAPRCAATIVASSCARRSKAAPGTADVQLVVAEIGVDTIADASRARHHAVRRSPPESPCRWDARAAAAWTPTPARSAASSSSMSLPG